MKAVLAAVFTLAFLGSFPHAFAVEPVKFDAETTSVIDQALKRFASRASSQNERPLVPTGFFKPLPAKDTKSEWQECLIFFPSAKVVPDFPARELERQQKRLGGQKEKRLIAAYVIIHDGDKKVHLVLHQGDSAVQKLFAPYESHAQIAKLKLSDFKPE